MIRELPLKNGLIRRWSDQCVYIQDKSTSAIYIAADDYPDDVRKKRGFEACSYAETDIEADEKILNELGLTFFKKKETEE